MSIKLKGSTDGSVILQAPADTSPTGTDKTLILPTTEGSANQFVKNGGTAGELEYSSMVETSTGVGIGTSSPGEEFVVRANAPSIQLESSNANGRNYGFQSMSDGKFHVYDGTAGANRVTLDSSGRLLVGTDTARTAGAGGHAQLQVKSPSSVTSDTSVIAAKFHGNSSAASSETLIACASGYSISANDTEGHALFGAVREGNGNNAGFIVKTGIGNTERFRVSSGGVLTTNTVQQHFDRGSSTGNSSFSRDFSVGSTQSALIIAGFNHYGLFSYGCTRLSFAATGASFSTSDIHNQTSSPGGSWSISKPQNHVLRVTKNAGNYNGSGHWFIHVIAS